MKKIALVEDNPDNRLLVAALLEDLYVVDEYVDGETALRGFLDAPPDLVLMDISLPDLSGEEVLARMKEEESLRDIPTIALTAHAMRDDEARFLESGFDKYVSKPIVDEEVLFSAISELLGHNG